MRAPDFWQKRGFLARLMAPIGALYGASVTLRAEFSSPFDPGIPIICVGNLTAGGTGKTPIAIAIAENLRARGKKPFFLTRGYGGRERGPTLASRAHSSAQMGDEALLLARHAQTVVAKARATGARLAVEKGADVLIMDDGHQNFAVTKTLSLVVVDAETGFGNGFQIPAGPLREPIAQGLRRADVVVLVGDGDPDLRDFDRPVLRAHIAADGADFAGQRIFAFAGIGRPQKFFATLEDSGAEITGTCEFPDHHPFTEDELMQLRAVAGEATLVTTEKDFVRMTVAQREGIKVLKAAAKFDQPGALSRLLDSTVGTV